jgi:hypothetical protein
MDSLVAMDCSRCYGLLLPIRLVVAAMASWLLWLLWLLSFAIAAIAAMDAMAWCRCYGFVWCRCYDLVLVAMACCRCYGFVSMLWLRLDRVGVIASCRCVKLSKEVHLLN